MSWQIPAVHDLPRKTRSRVAPKDRAVILLVVEGEDAPNDSSLHPLPSRYAVRRRERDEAVVSRGFVARHAKASSRRRAARRGGDDGRHHSRFLGARLVDGSFADDVAAKLGPFALVNSDSQKAVCR